MAVFFIIVALFAGFYLYLLLPARTPELAIKKYVLRQGHPLDAFNLKIIPTNIYDQGRRQFAVEGYYAGLHDLEEVPFFWLKKDERGWYVEEAGTGP